MNPRWFVYRSYNRKWIAAKPQVINGVPVHPLTWHFKTWREAYDFARGQVDADRELNKPLFGYIGRPW